MKHHFYFFIVVCCSRKCVCVVTAEVTCDGVDVELLSKFRPREGSGLRICSITKEIISLLLMILFIVYCQCASITMYFLK